MALLVLVTTILTTACQTQNSLQTPAIGDTLYGVYVGDIPRGAMYSFATDPKSAIHNPAYRLVSYGCENKDIGLVKKVKNHAAQLHWENGVTCSVGGIFSNKVTFQPIEILNKRNSYGSAYRYSEIVALAGEPIKTEYFSNFRFSQWCKTYTSDTFGVGVFDGETLVSSTEYSPPNLRAGDCAAFVRSAENIASKFIIENNARLRNEKFERERVAKEEQTRIQNEKFEADKLRTKAALHAKAALLKNDAQKFGKSKVSIRYIGVYEQRNTYEIKERLPSRYIRTEICHPNPTAKYWIEGLLVRDYLILDQQAFDGCKVLEKSNSLSNDEWLSYQSRFPEDASLMAVKPFQPQDYGIKDCRSLQCNDTDTVAFQKFMQWRAEMLRKQRDSSLKSMQILNEMNKPRYLVQPSREPSDYKIRCTEDNDMLGLGKSVECEVNRR